MDEDADMWICCFFPLQQLVAKTASFFPGGAGFSPPPAPASPLLSHTAAWDNNSSTLLAARSTLIYGPLKPTMQIATNSFYPLFRHPS